MSNPLEGELQKVNSRRGFFRKIGEATGIAVLTSVVLNSSVSAENDPSVLTESSDEEQETSGLTTLKTEAPIQTEPTETLSSINLKNLISSLNLSLEVEQQYFGEAEKAEPGKLVPASAEEKAIQNGRVRKFPDATILHIATPYGNNTDNIIMFDPDTHIVKLMAVNLSVVGALEIKDLESKLGPWDTKKTNSDGTDYYIWASQGVTGLSDNYRGPRHIDNLWLYEPLNLEKYSKTWGYPDFPTQSLYY